MTACIGEAVGALFCKPDSRSSRLLDKPEGLDKIFKFIQSLLPVVAEGGRYFEASEGALSHIKTMHIGVGVARDVTGTLKSIQLIPKVVARSKLICPLVKTIHNGEDFYFGKPLTTETKKPKSIRFYDGNGDEGYIEYPFRSVEVTRTRKHNEVALTTSEKLLVLGETAGGLLSGSATIFGFGTARQAANIRKYFGVQYGPELNGLADFFPYAMSVAHVGSFFENSFKLAYLLKAYNRDQADLLSDATQMKKEFCEKFYSTVMKLVEQILELVGDGFLYSGVPVPLELKLPLGLAISTIGLVRVWHDT